MTRYWIVAAAVTLLVVSAHAQERIIRSERLPRSPGCEESKHLYELSYDNAVGKPAAGATFEVRLLTLINSSKDKPGKKITAVVTDNGAFVENTKVRHRAKVVGHIEEVQKRDETHPEARLRVVFDRVKLKHGRTLAFVGVVHDLGSEHIANTEYWEPSATDPLGHWVHVSDWPSELGQYCYAADPAQGVLITSQKSNIHMGYYTLLTIRALSSQP
jgi:hypothetical protein